MTLRVPSWLENGSYTANADRLLLQSLLGGSPSTPLTSCVVGENDFQVTQTGTASMTLDVYSGAAWVIGSQSSNEGAYNVVNDDTTQTVTIGTSDPTNPRIDLVVLLVRNTEYSGTHDDAVLSVIAGTPAASPVAPSVPADALLLAKVTVGAGVTTITAAHISDQRQILLGASGVYPAGGLHLSTALSMSASSHVEIGPDGSTTADFLRSAVIASSGRLVVPITGLYQVSAGWFAASAASAAGTECLCEIYVNGVATYTSGGGDGTSGHFPGKDISRLISLSAGDAVGWGYYFNGGVSGVHVATGAYLTAVLHSI